MNHRTEYVTSQSFSRSHVSFFFVFLLTSHTNTQDPRQRSSSKQTKCNYINNNNNNRKTPNHGIVKEKSVIMDEFKN